MVERAQWKPAPETTTAGKKDGRSQLSVLKCELHEWAYLINRVSRNAKYITEFRNRVYRRSVMVEEGINKFENSSEKLLRMK